jgi:hypothetical protein
VGVRVRVPTEERSKTGVMYQQYSTLQCALKPLTRCC